VIRCRVARRHVDAAFERELALEDRFDLEAHLAQCSACTEYERRVRGLQELLEGPGDPAPTAPDVTTAARVVFARLDRGEGRPWRPRRARPVALAAAGVIALAAALFVLLSRGRTEPPPAPTTPPVAEQSVWTPARVEVAVRAALLASFMESGADEDRARERFLGETREAARSGWPVRRFVEGLLDSPDAGVARAAARCLGALGEPGAVAALERALARSELAEGALEALGALGEPAVPGLARALNETALAPRALLQLCRIGGPRAAEVVERAARVARADSRPSRATLLDALTTTGPAAVASLLHLAAEASDRGESSAILGRLPLVSGAGPELARALERERLAGDLAYRALLVLRPVEALPWLEERCATHRERALALETLANYPDSAPLGSALRLTQGGRVPREDVKRLLVGLLERDPERAVPFTRDLAADPEAPLRPWLELLIESEHPAAARALVPLVFCGNLPAEDRQWAALAVGELGAASDAEELLAELAPCATEDRRRTAACLLAIHRQLGAEGVERLLAPCSPASLRRVLSALEGDGSGEAVRTHRVARALEGALVELAAASEETGNAP